MSKKTFLTIIAGLVIGLAANNASASLVAWYQFSGNANDSAGSNNGTLNNGATIITDSQRGQVLSLDGLNDYVDCGSGSSLNVTQFTWALWIKRGETTYSNERSLLSTEGGTNTQGTYGLQLDRGGSYQDKIQLIKHGMEVSVAPLSTTPIQDMQWHHIAVTRSSDNAVAIYIDGILDATGTLAERTNFVKLVIGDGHTEYSNFKGLMDDVRVYNNVLSAEEVRALIPEPATLLLLGLGGMMLRRKRT